MTDETRPAADDDMTKASGWDALLDDLFGLNFRAALTVWASVARPAALFTAARAPGWLDRYTPSLRLVFTLMAATVVLRFLWASDGSPLMQTIMEMMRETPPEGLPPADPLDTARTLMNNFLLAFPFTYFACHFLVSLLVRIWGKGTPAYVRIRLYFASLLPALVFGLIQTVFYALVPQDQLYTATLISWVLGMVIYSLTVFRGLRPVHSVPGRAWRSVLFATIVASTDFTMSGVTFLVAMIMMYV